MSVPVFGVAAAALCAVALAALVRKGSPAHALLISLGTAAVLLLLITQNAAPLLDQVKALADAGTFSSQALPLMLRAVGVTLVGQVVSRLCKDAGESALAYTVEVAARAAVLAMALPAARQLVEILGRIAAL